MLTVKCTKANPSKKRTEYCTAYLCDNKDDNCGTVCISYAREFCFFCITKGTELTSRPAATLLQILTCQNVSYIIAY
jgi:hypothetical protein